MFLATVLAFAIAPAVNAQVVLDLAVNEADHTVEVQERFDYMGQAAAVGDFDGDGLADLVAGGFIQDGPDGNRIDCGQVIVEFRSRGIGPETLRSRTVRIYGANPGDRLGIAVVTGDLDGDGLDDLAMTGSGIAGPLGDRAEAGGAAILFGKTLRDARSGLIDLAVTAPDVWIYAPDTDDSRGGSFQFVPAAIGDFDDDGFDDLVLGLPGADGANGSVEGAGELHVAFGAATWPAVIDLRTQSQLVVHGEDVGDLLGTAVTVGNFNGDAFDDFVGGAKNSAGAANQGSRVGEAVGIFGRPSFPAVIDLAAGDNAGFIVYGKETNDRSSRALAAGDLNGDGFDDLVSGARHADGGSNLPDQESAGEAYVVLGAAGFGGDYFLEADTALLLLGRDRNDSIGYTVAVGDLDGDGYGDLVSGGQFGDGIDNGRYKSGEVVVILGGPTLPGVVDLRFDTAPIHIHGALPNDSVGSSLAIGDWDGDGIDDLLTGATGRVYKQLTIPDANDDLTSDDGGVLYVIRGSRLWVNLLATPQTVAAGDSFLLATRLTNFTATSLLPEVTVNWVAEDASVDQLKQKTIEVVSGSRRIPRDFPIAGATPPGTYALEIILRDGSSGALFDRDKISIVVE